MKRKIISLSIILCFILTFMISFTSNAAENDVSFNITNMNVQKGDTIIVKVNMNCINNFNAGNFVISYDSSVLEYAPYYNEQDVVDFGPNYGQTISSQTNTFVVINSATAGTIKVGYTSTSSVSGKNGEFLKLRFNVKNDANYGNSIISMTATTLKNQNGDNLTAEFNNGTISILSEITINYPTMELTVGEEAQLNVTPANGTIFENVTWTSNNSAVSVTPNTDTKSATITAVSAGTATITATVGGVSATCNVTVSEPPVEYTISINNPDWNFLPPMQKRALNVTFNPVSQAEGKNIDWSSEKPEVATIDSTTGVITAVGTGTTVIKAEVEDEDKSSTYTLTVSGMLGDIDNDSNITSYDAYRALLLDVNKELSTNNPDEVVLLDVDRDGTMLSNDAYMILKYSVGLINSFINNNEG